MPTFNGRSAYVYENATAIGQCTGWTLNVSTPVESAALIGEGGTAKAPGAVNWTAQVNTLWDDGDAQQENLQTACEAGTTVTILFFPEGGDTGSDQMTGTAYVASYEIDAQGTGFVARNVTLEGVGALTHGTAP